MEEGSYVGLADDVAVVYGALRAAVFDFRSGAVYSVNSAGAAALQAIDRGDPLKALDTAGQDFVAELMALRLLEYDPPHRSAPSLPAPPGLDFLWIELTGRCNLGCDHCYAGSQNPALFPTAPPRMDAPPLTFDQWDDVLRQAAELGCRAVQFIGGEALLDRRLMPLIDRAQTYGFTYIEVYTNGTLLTEQKARALAQRDVRLAVSLHGTMAATHDAVVGLAGSFDRTVRGLGLLADHAVPFRVNGVATAQNQHDILAVREFGAALGANETRIDLVRPLDATFSPDGLPDDPALLAHKWLLAPDFVAMREQFVHNRHWNACWAGKLSITPDGQVMPCIMGRTQAVGNVAHAPLADLLAGPALQGLWRLTKDQIAVCRDCEYRYTCGDCRPLATAEGGHYAKTARCTYDPTRGDWGRPWTDERFPSPAAEGLMPRLQAVTAPLLVASTSTLGECNPDRPPGCDPTRPAAREFHQQPCNPDRPTGCNPDRPGANHVH